MRSFIARGLHWASDLSEMWILRAIRKGLMYNLPLILIGSMVILVLNLPLTFFQTSMDNLFGTYWREWLLFVNDGTLQVLSVGVLVGISSAVFLDDKFMREHNLPLPVGNLVILGCYLMFVKGEEVLPANMAANTGLFLAIFIGVTVTSLFIWFYKHRIVKMNLYTYNADHMLNQTMSVIEPALLTFLTVAMFKLIITKTGIGEININIFTSFLQSINAFLATVIFEIATQLLWFLGLHGSNILENVTKDIFNHNASINALLVLQNKPPTEIFTKSFLDIFVYMGGSGSALALILAFLIKGNRNSTYRMAKFSILPGIFNINELIIFGLPVVLNPFFLIPFLLTPVVLSATAYCAMAFGLVPLTIDNQINWTTPIILGGYAATGSISGSILQVVNLAIGTIIYIPFVRSYERHKEAINKEVLSRLIADVLEGKRDKSNLIDQKDEIGNLARSLAHDIRSALVTGKNLFHLEFQPQITYDGRLAGAEALLRWRHEFYGFIPPPVIIRIAEEAGLTDQLGNWIIKTALEGMTRMDSMGIRGISLSINLTAEQIKNKELVEFVRMCLYETGIDPDHIEFELTEGATFEQTAETMQALNAIKKLGVKLAIDDFGMGHSSLLYIKDFHVDTVKLDKILVQDIVNDVNSQEIVSSISSLCNMLNLTLIAEFVETGPQREKLNWLGCRIYQGYFYSKSLPIEEFIAYSTPFADAQKMLYNAPFQQRSDTLPVASATAESEMLH